MVADSYKIAYNDSMTTRKTTLSKLHTKRQYSYAGEEQAYELVVWLNAARDSRRIVAVLGTLQQLQKPQKQPFRGRSRDLFFTLLEQLQNLWMRPVPRFDMSLRGRELYGRFFIGWKVMHGTDVMEFPRRGRKFQLGKFQFGEGDAFQRIVELSERGLVDRVRRCQQCQKWFFARVERKHHCSRKCLLKSFSQSKEFKARRAAYMDNYRKDVKGKSQFK